MSPPRIPDGRWSTTKGVRLLNLRREGRTLEQLAELFDLSRAEIDVALRYLGDAPLEAAVAALNSRAAR